MDEMLRLPEFSAEIEGYRGVGKGGESGGSSAPQPPSGAGGRQSRGPSDSGPHPTLATQPPCMLQRKSYSRQWWIVGRVRVQLKDDDGTFCNPDIRSREPCCNVPTASCVLLCACVIQRC